MKSQSALILILACLLCSCATRSQPQSWRHAVSVEYDLDGPSAKYVKLADFDAIFKRLGLRVISNDRDAPDFCIDVKITVLDGFTDFIYQVYYKDSLYSVKLEVEVDGEINQAKTDMAFKILNNELLTILTHYPYPSKEELKTSGRRSDESDPFAEPQATPD